MFETLKRKKEKKSIEYKTVMKVSKDGVKCRRGPQSVELSLKGKVFNCPYYAIYIHPCVHCLLLANAIEYCTWQTQICVCVTPFINKPIQTTTIVSSFCSPVGPSVRWAIYTSEGFTIIPPS